MVYFDIKIVLEFRLETQLFLTNKWKELIDDISTL